MKKAAIIYDFDKTLCGRDMQEYSLIPDLGYDDPKQFWKEVNAVGKTQNMDPISAYLFLLKRKFEQAGNPITKEHFRDIGKTIDLNPGVDTWFERINAYGKDHNLEVEHYIISSGMQEILEDTAIAKYMKKIYACRYYYNEEGLAEWPAQLVNYTTKTQYIFRINKQVLDEGNDRELNRWVPMDQREVPFKRMIYIADGITDVPCMKLVISRGGHAIAVYTGEKNREVCDMLVHGRVQFIAPTDYTEGSEIESIVKGIFDSVAANSSNIAITRRQLDEANEILGIQD